MSVLRASYCAEIPSMLKMSAVYMSLIGVIALFVHECSCELREESGNGKKSLYIMTKAAYNVNIVFHFVMQPSVLIHLKGH